MSNLRVRAKAALLAFSIAASTSNVVCSEPSSTIMGQMGSFITNNKTALALSTIVAALVAGEICLMTDQRVTYSYDNWTEDVKEFLGAYNLFDAESRAVVKRFIKKYFVGARVRLDDQTIRTKEENGTVSTIKRKKLSQKPSGFMGLLDAYIFQQLKPITDFVTPAATFYVLIVNPYLLANKEMKNYKSEDKGQNVPKPLTIEDVKQVLQMLQHVVPNNANNDIKVV